MTQAEFDFDGGENGGKDRPFHHATTLTVSADTYRWLSHSSPTRRIEATFVNDIVSTTKCGQENKHHPVRRLVLLRRQFAGDYRRVLVRSEMGNEIECTLLGVRGCDADTDCTGTAYLSNGYTKPKRGNGK